MKKTRVLQLLPKLFVEKERKNGANGTEKYICFSDVVFNRKSYSKDIYEAVSNAMFDSNLTHNFSYEIASRAVDVIVNIELKDDTVDDFGDDNLTEFIDSLVPVYNWELMQMYTSDYWAVDEAMEEYGDVKFDSVKAAQIAWYTQIENMVHSIIGNLKPLIETK